MDISLHKNKTQSFIPWIIDNLRAMRTNIWKLVGLWSITISFMLLLSYN